MQTRPSDPVPPVHSLQKLPRGLVTFVTGLATLFSLSSVTCRDPTFEASLDYERGGGTREERGEGFCLKVGVSRVPPRHEIFYMGGYGDKGTGNR